METLAATFTDFFKTAEPKLRHALVATYGLEVGIESASDALAYGWEHWDRVRSMVNPIGYLYRVGRSKSRRFRRRLVLPDVPSSGSQPWVEPALPRALAELSPQQRTCVILVHSLGWTFSETATLLGISVGTVEVHVQRGLKRLRRRLGVTS